MTNPTDSHRTGRRSFLKTSAFAVAGLAFSRLGFASALGAAKAAATLPSAMELAVNLELAAPSGGRYNRPYVAVYIEDAQGKLVRTVSLWAETSGRGQRYLSDLRRWFSESGGAALLPTATSPTRNPGKYSLVWDGKTDKNAAAPQGDYYVVVEAAREHGPYGVVREKVTLGTAPVKKALDTSVNPDLASVSLDYRKKA
jgi:hypothetical protein